MLVEESPRSFVKRNNSYSHCPLKKRPVHVVLYDQVPEAVKEETIDVVSDDTPEPENLSTKPEDLSKRSKRSSTPSSVRSLSPEMDVETVAMGSEMTAGLPMSHQHHHQLHHHHHHHHHPEMQPNHDREIENESYEKSMTPPMYRYAKKERSEIIQHDGIAASTGAIAPIQRYIGAKSPLEPLNLNTPIEPIAHYATPAWTRVAPLYPPHYLPYPSAYRFPHHHPGAELYPAYPIAAYSSPEYGNTVTPPPHGALTCPTIQRPIARSYAHWSSSSPDNCGSSPTSSLGYGSPRSPPPVTPEDLSSPGSDSGRSSAGSTSTGTTALIGVKIENGNVVDHRLVNSASSSSSTSSSSGTTSPRCQCPDCGKSYSTYSGLSKHRQFHCAAALGRTKKSFSCKYCEKVYVSMGALKMHIRTHTLPCKCHLCGKAFSRPWLLQGHIRTHTGEKPFSCQHCNRAFADRSNLRAHLQTHSDVKKYSCASCSKTFSRMSLLTKHQEGGCPGMAVPVGYPC